MLVIENVIIYCYSATRIAGRHSHNGLGQSTQGNCHRVAKFESTLGTAQQSVEFMNEHCSAAAGCQKKKVELELHLQHNCSRCLSLVLPFYFCLVEHDVPTCKIQIKLAGLVSIVAF